VIAELLVEHSKGMVGRPVDKEKVDAFDKMCEWLEAEVHELLTLDKLIEKAQIFAVCDTSVYSHRQLKRKLQERYGDHIFFATDS